MTADPDYLPRSIDLGLNVEGFHRRFCDGCPEPYVMLAVLCSHVEPDARPSFDKVIRLIHDYRLKEKFLKPWMSSVFPFVSLCL